MNTQPPSHKLFNQFHGTQEVKTQYVNKHWSPDPSFKVKSKPNTIVYRLVLSSIDNHIFPRKVTASLTNLESHVKSTKWTTYLQWSSDLSDATNQLHILKTWLINFINVNRNENEMISILRGQRVPFPNDARWQLSWGRKTSTSSIQLFISHSKIYLA